MHQQNKLLFKQDLAPILISPPHTYVPNHGNDDRGNKRRWHKHIQTKANTDKLCETMQNQRYSTIKKETTQPRRLIRALPAPWVLSTAGKLLRYLRGSYLLLDRNPSFCFVPPIFSSFLSIVDLLISVLCTQIERSLLSIQDTPLTADWLQVCLGHGPTLRSKAFFKNCLVHL